MVTVNLFSEKEGEVNKFLSHFYNTNLDLDSALKWNKEYNNPIEMVDLISAIIDNNDKYSISAWVNLDEDIFIKISNSNLNDIIKYLYERYPN